MTWYAILEKKPKYNQRVIVALSAGFMRVMDYRGKVRNLDDSFSYKFAKTTNTGIYYCYSKEDFRWAEIDSEPVFD